MKLLILPNLTDLQDEVKNTFVRYDGDIRLILLWFIGLECNDWLVTGSNVTRAKWLRKRNDITRIYVTHLGRTQIFRLAIPNVIIIDNDYHQYRLKSSVSPMRRWSMLRLIRFWRARFRCVIEKYMISVNVRVRSFLWSAVQRYSACYRLCCCERCE